MTYLGISMWGLPAMLIVFAATGLLRGHAGHRHAAVDRRARVRRERAAQLAVHLRPRLGHRRLGRGTVVAQWGMVAAYVVVIGRLARAARGIRPSSPRGRARLGALGGWLFLRTLSLRVALLATVVVATGLGTEELAGWQVAFTIFSTAAFALDALAIAAQALIGKGLGAGDEHFVRRVLGRTVAWGAWFGVIVGAVIGALLGRDRARVHRGCRDRGAACSRRSSCSPSPSRCAGSSSCSTAC